MTDLGGAIYEVKCRKQGFDARIVEAIKDHLAALFAGHKAILTQPGQVLGQGRLRQAGQVCQISRRAWPLDQGTQDQQAVAVGQQLEQGLSLGGAALHDVERRFGVRQFIRVVHLAYILDNANISNRQLQRKAIMMSKSYPDITARISTGLKTLRKDIPDTMAGFSALAQATTRSGALDKKTKELIALSIGVATRCDGCIGFHAEALVKLGASRAEIEETLGMAIYMGGGPSLMYAADAVLAFEQFGGGQTPVAA